jgi:hypothetical protein
MRHINDHDWYLVEIGERSTRMFQTLKYKFREKVKNRRK